MPEADPSHAAFEKDFSDLYEGTLGEPRTREVQDHLATCARCAAEYQSFREAVGAVSGLGRLTAPRNFDGKVADTIHRRSDGRFFGRRAFGDRIPFELLAALALAAMVAIYFFVVRWRN